MFYTKIAGFSISLLMVLGTWGVSVAGNIDGDDGGFPVTRGSDGRSALMENHTVSYDYHGTSLIPATSGKWSVSNPPLEYLLSYSPTNVIGEGDLDQDGNLEFFRHESFTQTISVHNWNGTGISSVPVWSYGYGQPMETVSAVITDDFTDDGRPDVVVSCRGYSVMHTNPLGVDETTAPLTLRFLDGGTGTLFKSITRYGGWDNHQWQSHGQDSSATVLCNYIFHFPGNSHHFFFMGLGCGYGGKPRGGALYDLEDGRELWYFAAGNPFSGSVEDLDQDGGADIVFDWGVPRNGAYGSGINGSAMNTTDFENYLLSINLDLNGSVRYARLPDPAIQGGTLRSTIEDLDNDGDWEITVLESHSGGYWHSGYSRIHRYDTKTGTESFPPYTGPYNNAGYIAIGDVCGNASKEVMAVFYDGSIVQLDGLYLKPLRTLTLPQGPRAHSCQISLADLNGDSKSEVLIDDYGNGILYVLGAELQVLSSLKYDTTGLYNVALQSVWDMNRDGYADFRIPKGAVTEIWTVAPALLKPVVCDGKAWTNNSTLDVSVGFQPVMEGIFADDFDVGLSNDNYTFSWFPVSNISDWNLSGNDETQKTIYMKLRNETGHISTTTCLKIGLDTIPPRAPVAREPLDLTALNSRAFNLSWKPSYETGSGIDYYELEVNGSLHETTVLRMSTNSTTVLAENLSAGTYAWHVRGLDIAGNCGDWSNENRFLISSPLIGTLFIGDGSGFTNSTSLLEINATGTNISNVTVYLNEVSELQSVPWPGPWNVDTSTREDGDLLVIGLVAENRTFSPLVGNDVKGTVIIDRSGPLNISVDNITFNIERLQDDERGHTDYRVHLAWDQPIDCPVNKVNSGINGYRYAVAPASQANQPALVNWTTNRTLTFETQEHGDWRFYLSAVDRCGNVGKKTVFHFQIDAPENTTDLMLDWADPALHWNKKVSKPGEGIEAHLRVINLGPNHFQAGIVYAYLGNESNPVCGFEISNISVGGSQCIAINLTPRPMEKTSSADAGTVNVTFRIEALSPKDHDNSNDILTDEVTIGKAWMELELPLRVSVNPQKGSGNDRYRISLGSTSPAFFGSSLKKAEFTGEPLDRLVISGVLKSEGSPGLVTEGWHVVVNSDQNSSLAVLAIHSLEVGMKRSFAMNWTPLKGNTFLNISILDETNVVRQSVMLLISVERSTAASQSSRDDFPLIIAILGVLLVTCTLMGTAAAWIIENRKSRRRGPIPMEVTLERKT